MGRLWLPLPQLQAKSAELIDSPDRIPQLVELIGNLHRQAIGTPVENLSGPEPRSLSIIYRDCIYCVGQSHVQNPVCANIPALYKQLIFELTGKRCQVSETCCGAVEGEPDCHFVLKYPLF